MSFGDVRIKYGVDSGLVHLAAPAENIRPLSNRDKTLVQHPTKQT